MLKDDPEDLIEKEGATRKVFEDLYSNRFDPWFGDISNAEKVRMALTETIVRKYADESNSMLDFGCGNRMLTDKLPGFLTGIDIAFHNDNAIDKAFTETYDYICSFNVLYYYSPEKWKEMLWNFHESLIGSGYCFVSVVITGPLSVDIDEFRKEFTRLFELIMEQAVTIDWHEDFEYRESSQYSEDLTKGLGDPTQILLVGRKI